MQKIVAVIFIFIVSALTSAQTSNVNLSKPPVTDSNTSNKISYSESIPYQPAKFDNQKSKSKKDKKAKDDSPKVNDSSTISGNLPNNEGQNTALVEYDLITVPVSVFNQNKKFVQGLQRSDFKIFVDNIEQEIVSFETKDQPLNFILLIDTSPSTTYKIEEIQNYALSIIEQLRPQDKVMVVEFNGRTNILTELTEDRQKIHNAIRSAKFANGTSLYDAVQNLLKKQISLIQGRKAIVLLTDGVDTTSIKASYETSLTEAEKSDSAFYPIHFDTFGYDSKQPMKQTLPSTVFDPFPVVGIKNAGQSMGSTKAEYELGKQYLNDLVLISGGRAFSAKSISNGQKKISSNIGEELRLQYYISLRPLIAGQTVRRRQIKVRVNRPGLLVLTRGSFINSK